MSIIFFAVCFLSCTAGAICGIGGGVIIKPVLDALNVMSVSAISFLSGLTVLSMSIISVYKAIRKKVGIDLKTATPLAIGGAVGGLVGKQLFQYIYLFFPQEDTVGAIQALILGVITVGTLVYTLCQSKIRTYQVKNIAACAIIGLILGLISAFLGIGGGPINIVVLGFFFSLDIKKAAASSLYIILFSQLTSFLSTVVTGTIPEVNYTYLIMMVAGGILGGIIGNMVNRKIKKEAVNKLFIALMLIIILICIYNFLRFMGYINL